MAGRPSEFTEDMRQKLEHAAAMGCSDTEIALYCDISRQTLYNWKEKYPEIVDRIEQLRERPILLARKTIIDNLDNPQYALEYLKRKRKSEFSERQENTGADGQPMGVVMLPQKDENTLGTTEETDTSTEK